jgi:dynactin complex subunit
MIGYMRAFSSLLELSGVYRSRLEKSPSEALKKGLKQVSEGLIMLGTLKEDNEHLKERLNKSEYNEKMMSIEKKRYERKIKQLEEELKTLKENIENV